MAREAFDRLEALLERHRRLVWAMCWRRAFGNRERCREMLQDVCVRLLESSLTLPDASDEKAERQWVILRVRSVLDHWRRYSAEIPAVVPLSHLHLSPLEEAVDASDQEQCELVDTLQAYLDKDDQRLLTLIRQGLTNEEVAKKLGISLNTYYQRYHRVILRMRTIYDKLYKSQMI